MVRTNILLALGWDAERRLRYLGQFPLRAARLWLDDGAADEILDELRDTKDGCPIKAVLRENLILNEKFKKRSLEDCVITDKSLISFKYLCFSRNSNLGSFQMLEVRNFSHRFDF